MQTQLWGSYEGEIYAVQEKAQNDYKNLIRYTCLVHFPEGIKLIPNVRQSSMIGGIADYWRRRATATKDDSDSTQAVNGEDQPDLDATVGERVIITFLNGNISNPVITGYLQHENQALEESLNGSDPDPNAVLQYLGIRVEVNSDGELRLIHKGKPEVSFAPQGTPASAGLTNALSSLDTIGGNNSPAIKPAETTEITLLEFLQGGVFRIRDQEGQIIEIDRTKKRIYLSNNDLKSTEDASKGPLSGGNLIATNSTDAEYLLLDKDKELALLNARSIAQIYSGDRRKDVTEGDFSNRVNGDLKETIGGDDTRIISGSRSVKIQGDDDLKIQGSWTVTAVGGIELADGAGGKLTVDSGKVALAGTAGELLDLVNKTLSQMIQSYQDLIDPSQQPYGNLGLICVVNPTLVANVTQIITQLTQIQTTLGLITA